MKKVVLIPDSFKGTMSSEEICAIMASQVKAHFPACQVISIPVADGGEGSVDCFLTAMGGQKIQKTVKGPYMEDMQGFYGLLKGGKTAVIEMAACAGLPLVGKNRDARKTTTYGVGQLILDAVEQGCRELIIGLGGSATNDGGCGAAAAVGVRFFNQNGEAFVPTGGTLKDICKIDMSGVNPKLKEVQITAMCDIDNPMYGPTGAAHVFGPQKGATTPELVEELDAGLMHLAARIKEDLGQDLAQVPGTGAAGAMGAGMMAFFGASLKMGIEAVLDTVGFDTLAKDADVVFTGEGRIDTQSLRGKVVIGVGRRAKTLGVPVVAVVGDIGDNIEAAYDMGVSCVMSINRVALPFEQLRPRAKNDMALTMDSIMRLYKLAQK